MRQLFFALPVLALAIAIAGCASHNEQQAQTAEAAAAKAQQAAEHAERSRHSRRELHSTGSPPHLDQYRGTARCRVPGNFRSCDVSAARRRSPMDSDLAARMVGRRAE